MRYLSFIFAVLVAVSLTAPSVAVERFPPPDFESGHSVPTLATPPPDADIYDYVDTVVLFAALVVSAYMVLKKRSRRWIFALTVYSVIYFGFWRKGCVCPIGAIQNVTLSFFNSNYAVPLVVLLFFMLPLIFTLFFGRVFCAGVCPLGAMQDLVLLKPLNLPRWLEGALRLFAYAYLGLAVLFAAIGDSFIICRYDPFIAFFRLNGNINMVILGLCVLVVGVFVGRPYCRFICPYGVILRQLSRISRYRVTITPDECIQCRLCEDSCPFSAVNFPSDKWPDHDHSANKKMLVVFILLFPILVFLGGWSVSKLGPTMSRTHPAIRLAQQIYAEDTGKITETTDAATAFRSTGEKTDRMYLRATEIIEKFRVGGWLLGIFLGMVVGAKLIRYSIRWREPDYQADRAGCVACGRCFEYCPREHVRLNELSAGD